MMNFDIAFVPESDDITDFEIACQKVANYTDEWPWLAAKITGKTWVQIFDIVAAEL